MIFIIGFELMIAGFFLLWKAIVNPASTQHWAFYLCATVIMVVAGTIAVGSVMEIVQ